MSSLAHAGFFELGASGNFRLSKIDDNNYQELVSYTGTVSYYFWEMSALEFSYTQGQQTVVLKIPQDNKNTTITTFELFGLDLVLSLGDKQAAVIPYIKMGAAYITKEIYREIEGVRADKVDSPSGIVPSAGIGAKIRLTNTLGIKFGVDAWSSPLDKDPVTWDYAARAGVSWLF